VDGSEIYEVEVRLDEDGEILDIAYDCPYDWGEICKHQVAVLLAVRKQLETEMVQELLSLAERDRTLRQARRCCCASGSRRTRLRALRVAGSWCSSA
jgi:uncharacterized Zn finger protein